MPGRPRKPTSIHILQGTAQKCRMDARGPEMQVAGGMPEAPEWMPPLAQQEWGRISAISGYAKALRPSDMPMLVTYCLLWAEIAGHVKEFGSSAGIQSARLTTFAGIAAKLGMNPSDRSKVHVPSEEKPANKFAKLGS